MIQRIILIALVSGVLLPAQAPLAAPAKIQVLIITGRDSHDWRGVTPVMRQFLETAGIFEVRIAEEFRDVGPASLRGYAVAVLVCADKNRRIAGAISPGRHCSILSIRVRDWSSTTTLQPRSKTGPSLRAWLEEHITRARSILPFTNSKWISLTAIIRLCVV